MVNYFEDIPCNRGETGCCKTIVSFCKNSLGETVKYINKELIGLTCDQYPTELDFEDILNNTIEYYQNIYTNPVIDYYYFPCESSCNN